MKSPSIVERLDIIGYRKADLVTGEPKLLLDQLLLDRRKKTPVPHYLNNPLCDSCCTRFHTLSTPPDQLTTPRSTKAARARALWAKREVGIPKRIGHQVDRVVLRLNFTGYGRQNDFANPICGDS